MIPWLDIIIIVLLFYSAYQGYQKGFLGALRKILASILGFFIAWLTSPMLVAWVEVKWGLNAKLIGYFNKMIPKDLQKLLEGLNSTMTSLQELKLRILSLPVPEKVGFYLQKAVDESTASWHLGMTPNEMADVIIGNFAHAITAAIAFLIIYLFASLLVRGFLGLLTSGSGPSIIGLIDGVLGMVASVLLQVTLIIVIVGAIYPIVLLRSMNQEGGVISHLVINSYSAQWMNEIYSQYILVWFS